MTAIDYAASSSTSTDASAILTLPFSTDKVATILSEPEHLASKVVEGDRADLAWKRWCTRATTCSWRTLMSHCCMRNFLRKQVISCSRIEIWSNENKWVDKFSEENKSNASKSLKPEEVGCTDPGKGGTDCPNANETGCGGFGLGGTRTYMWWLTLDPPPWPREDPGHMQTDSSSSRVWHLCFKRCNVAGEAVMSMGEGRDDATDDIEAATLPEAETTACGWGQRARAWRAVKRSSLEARRLDNVQEFERLLTRWVLWLR